MRQTYALLGLLALLALSTQAVATLARPLPAASAHQPFIDSKRVRPDNVRIDVQTDCALKELAWEYAVKLQGKQQPAASAAVHDALELTSVCGLETPLAQSDKQYSRFFPTQLAWKRNDKKEEHTHHHRPHKMHLFVDASKGSDSHSGSKTKPLASLNQALRLIRFARPVSGPVSDLAQWAATITFREGVYYFPHKVEMGVRDSYITLEAHKDEEVVFSGGVDLTSLPFSVHKGSILVAPLPAGTCIHADCFNELFVGGRRSSRARWPNANPETQGIWTTDDTGYMPKAAAWLPPVPAATDATTIALATPSRKSLNFSHFQLGVGGVASSFSPAVSFWATANPPAGNRFELPSGLVVDPATWSQRTYADPSQAYIHALHQGHWGNWIFQVDQFLPELQTFTFGRGGFQEARGSWAGREWFIENLLEELDAPNEWWVDSVNGLLYLWPNDTQAMMEPRGDANDGKLYFKQEGSAPTLVASQLDTILSVQGSGPELLVESVHIHGITFAHTSSTFMRPHEVPSGGDWSINRLAALRLEQVRDASVHECVFNGLGGNGLVVSRAAHNTSIIGNEFRWLGASAILVVGDSAASIDSGAAQENFPLGTVIRHNMMHELGIWVKQSSAVSVALAQETTIDSNICFNLARACINFNDGFGGGSVVSHNLLFNSVRETDDHGAFNSWDRQPFLSRHTADSEPSILPRQNYIHHNFILSNYHSVWPIDHDDGSCHYTDHDNYLVYGGYKSYMGNSITARQNYYVLPDAKINAAQALRDHVQLEKQRRERKSKPQRLGRSADDRRSATAEQEEPSVFSRLSSVMQQRAFNMHKRYVLDPQRIAERDAAIASGTSVHKAVAAAAAAERAQMQNQFHSGDLSELDLSIVPPMAFWGATCAQNGGGHDQTWTNNSCALVDDQGEYIYNYWVCDLNDLSNTVPITAGNMFYASNRWEVSCQLQIFTLQQWQDKGYDVGSKLLPAASLDTMLDWGRQLFGLGRFQSEQDADPAAAAEDTVADREVPHAQVTTSTADPEASSPFVATA